MKVREGWFAAMSCDSIMQNTVHACGCLWERATAFTSAWDNDRKCIEEGLQNKMLWVSRVKTALHWKSGTHYDLLSGLRKQSILEDYQTLQSTVEAHSRSCAHRTQSKRSFSYLSFRTEHNDGCLERLCRCHWCRSGQWSRSKHDQLKNGCIAMLFAPQGFSPMQFNRKLLHKCFTNTNIIIIIVSSVFSGFEWRYW